PRWRGRARPRPPGGARRTGRRGPPGRSRFVAAPSRSSDLVIVLVPSPAEGQPASPREPEIIRIRLGLLDADPGRRPLAHIWVSEKAPWFEITDDLPRAERGGEDLAARMTNHGQASAMDRNVEGEAIC